MGIWSAYMAFSWHCSECECIGRRFIVGLLSIPIRWDVAGVLK